MILGYNTNGFAHHSLEQAIAVISALGYRSIAITIDHGSLSPFDSMHLEQLTTIRRLIKRHGLTPVIETGGRYLLDPVIKHEPTLVSPTKEGRAERVAFYRYAIDVAAELDAACVSLWAGRVQDEADDQTALERLATSLREVLEYAAGRNVTIALEPEPGMLVEKLADYTRVRERLDSPDNLRLTLDIGHLHCNRETPLADSIRLHAEQIANIHIEDMLPAEHEHLMFGDGDIDFPSVIAALEEIDYRGPITVELSRHSHLAPEAAREAFEFLSRLGVGSIQ